MTTLPDGVYDGRNRGSVRRACSASGRRAPREGRFRNPIEPPHFMVMTGGSTGRAARAPRSFGTLAVAQAIHHEANGVTVARSEMLRVLEHELPRQFGGTSVDYQLAEEVGPDGLARLILRVDPRVGAVDEPLVRATLLAGLDRGGAVDRHMAVLWRQAGTIVIRREEPVATAAGKVLPFYRDRRASPSA